VWEPVFVDEAPNCRIRVLEFNRDVEMELDAP
jgi:hypothetical protein